MAMSEDKVLSMVRKLIERAEHPDTGKAEADASRERADALMLKYAIDLAALNASRPADQKIKPGTMMFDLVERGSPFEQALLELALMVADYTRVKLLIYGFGSRMAARTRERLKADGYNFGQVRMKAYGFETDLKYFEYMWTVLNLHLLNGLEIKYDHSIPLDDNVFIMHNAGYNWLDIARSYGWRKTKPTEAFYDDDGELVPNAWVLMESHDGDPEGTVQTQAMVGKRFKRAYDRYIRNNKEERLSIPALGRVNFQLSFIRSYTSRVRARLREQQSKRATGSALILRSAFQDVLDMFAEDNPDVKNLKWRKEGRHNPEGWRRGHDHANTADLDGSKVSGADRKGING